MKDIKEILSKNPYGAYQKLKSLNLLNQVISLTSFLDDYYCSISWSQRFWHIKNDKYKIVYCEMCGKNPAKYRRSHQEYVSCSQKCSRIKDKQTCLMRYGKTSPNKLNKFKEKAKQTCRERYGTDYYQQTNEFKEKIINKNIKKYNIKHYQQTDEFKEKAKQTCRERYGTDNPAKNPEIKRKIKKTIQIRYGTDNPAKNPEIKRKAKQTCRERYGADYYLLHKDFKEKAKQTCRERYGTDYYQQTDEFKENFLDYSKQTLINKLPQQYKLLKYGKQSKLLHKLCGNEFIISNGLIYLRLKRYKTEICTCCNPINKGWSNKEKEVVNFLREIYNGVVVENNRKIIPPYELDIYLPDLKIAIEFNGDYYHSLDLVKERDLIKKEICKEKNINLFVIKEFEWNNNINTIKNELYKICKAQSR